MSISRTTPRMGRGISEIAGAQYPSFFAGLYIGQRDLHLIDARYSSDPIERNHSIDAAREAHRQAMRCIREYRREQRAKEAA